MLAHAHVGLVGDAPKADFMEVSKISDQVCQRLDDVGLLDVFPSGVKLDLHLADLGPATTKLSNFFSTYGGQVPDFFPKHLLI